MELVLVLLILSIQPLFGLGFSFLDASSLYASLLHEKDLSELHLTLLEIKSSFSAKYFGKALNNDILPDFDIDVSELCKDDLTTIFNGIRNTEDWALQWLDAMGKPTPAITHGGINWPGSYEQCQQVYFQNYTSENQGHYCTIKVPLLNNSILMLNIGVCAPSSCNKSEVINAMNVGN
ncbi:unnamed protein product [Protopolystoma xenopodis]|uniref:Nose resistant-to-fluoxetine protein N-terminal domain-containing protein n=1 Tax=Protopolystoma xenopodis TaxID=117903 RepID=A0A3S5BKK8_9PLAT|nr:unnamed protein product [Protopolystoma xenopodis]